MCKVNGFGSRRVTGNYILYQASTPPYMVNNGSTSNGGGGDPQAHFSNRRDLAEKRQVGLAARTKADSWCSLSIQLANEVTGLSTSRPAVHRPRLRVASTQVLALCISL